MQRVKKRLDSGQAALAWFDLKLFPDLFTGKWVAKTYDIDNNTSAVENVTFLVSWLFLRLSDKSTLNVYYHNVLFCYPDNLLIPNWLLIVQYMVLLMSIKNWNWLAF